MFHIPWIYGAVSAIIQETKLYPICYSQDDNYH